MQPDQPVSVTSSQVMVFAGNVNDRRVVSEARELAAGLDIDPDRVAAIHYIPARKLGGPATLVFDLYEVDAEGGRVYVPVEESDFVYDEDGAFIPIAPKVLLTQQTREFKGGLPIWWPQAARVVIAPEESS